MKENKQEIVKTVKKPSYEPVTVQVNEIAPVAVLCASGAGPSSAGGFSMKALSSGGSI